ncbi:MAG: hypothetical protein HY609_06670 [Deltaproteobacteria bacterium]|nr:hypothetical protein [Deltaproteobacteria bacterium]
MSDHPTILADSRIGGELYGMHGYLAQPGGPNPQERVDLIKLAEEDSNVYEVVSPKDRGCQNTHVFLFNQDVSVTKENRVDDYDNLLIAQKWCGSWYYYYLPESPSAYMSSSNLENTWGDLKTTLGLGSTKWGYSAFARTSLRHSVASEIIYQKGDRYIPRLKKLPHCVERPVELFLASRMHERPIEDFLAGIQFFFAISGLGMLCD